MIKKEESLIFYNSFQSKLILDYLDGNKRTERAIEFAVESLPENTKQALDFGCGIGWSSFEISKQIANAKVLGFDLSPKLIHTAKKLFGSKNNLAFQQGDFSSSENIKIENVDAFILIDVLEHIAKQDRNQLIQFIMRNANPKGGRLIITCPTVEHQEWLEKNNPEGLQPIDEKINLTTIKEIASELNGKVTIFNKINIWNQNDYFHCAIDWGDINVNSATKQVFRKESKWYRIFRVAKIQLPFALQYLIKKIFRNF